MCNFKWRFMQRWQCPIHNCTHEFFNRSINIGSSVVFTGLYVFNNNNSTMFSCSRNAQGAFVEKPQSNVISFTNHTHWYMIHTETATALKGTVENRALPSLHLKLGFSSPIKNSFIYCFNNNKGGWDTAPPHAFISKHDVEW